MEKTKVVSFRLAVSLLNRFNDFCLSMGYWKRNTILVCLLQNLLANASTSDLQKLVRWHRWNNCKLKITIEEIEISPDF